MRRAIFLAVLLGALLWWSARFQPRETGGLRVEGGSEGVGAAVYVNGHAVGHMRTASPRPDGSLVSRLDARVALWRWNDIVIVSARGVRLATRAVFSESTIVGVHFAGRRITVTPAGVGPVAADADTSAEFDD